MRKTKKTVVNLLVLTELLLAAVVLPANADFQISTHFDGYQNKPDVSGSIVVWHEETVAGNQNIHGYDLTTNTQFQIGTDANGQYFPAIDGSIVVWVDVRNGTWDIYGYNLTTNTEFPISVNAGTQWSPKISGPIVVWLDDRNGGSGDIYGYNITTSTEFPICTNPSTQKAIAVSGSIVVWADDRNGGGWDIYGYNITTGTEFPICTNSYEQLAPDISGTTVVWADWRNHDYDIYGYDLTSNTEFPIYTGSNWQLYPVISGSTVVWEHGQDLGYGYRSIYGYDLTTNTEFQICTNPYANPQAPAISGSMVVWTGLTSLFGTNPIDSVVDIYGASLLDGHDVLRPFDVNNISPFNSSSIGATGADITVAGVNDFADMWHVFDPNQQPNPTGDYTISLCGSSFNTTLAVFDEQFTELAFNDDYCSEQSQLSVIGLQTGKKYYIRVSGVNGAKGDYTLLIDGPAPQCVARPVSDLNDDCIVDFIDFGIMASEWLDCGYDLPQGCSN